MSQIYGCVPGKEHNWEPLRGKNYCSRCGQTRELVPHPSRHPMRCECKECVAGITSGAALRIMAACKHEWLISPSSDILICRHCNLHRRLDKQTGKCECWNQQWYKDLDGRTWTKCLACGKIEEANMKLSSGLAQAEKLLQTNCTCETLLNGHHNDCPALRGNTK